MILLMLSATILNCVGHARPTLRSMLTEGRIDNETAKWIDEGHVQCGETIHRLYVDCQVQYVAVRARRESERQKSMYGRVAQFTEGFVFKDVEHSKRALASPRRNLRLRVVGFGKAMNVRRTGWIMALVIPSERSTQSPPQRK